MLSGTKKVQMSLDKEYNLLSSGGEFVSCHFFCESVAKSLYFRNCFSGIFSAFFLGLFSKHTVMMCFENTFIVLFQSFPYLPQKQRFFFLKKERTKNC